MACGPETTKKESGSPQFTVPILRTTYYRGCPAAPAGFISLMAVDNPGAQLWLQCIRCARRKLPSAQTATTDSASPEPTMSSTLRAQSTGAVPCRSVPRPAIRRRR